MQDNQVSQRWTRSRLRAPVPEGWWEKESVTLLAPDGQANIIVSREPLDRTVSTEQYAAVQGQLLRNEFPGYHERSMTPIALPSGAAYVRHFSWTPPDGVPVSQVQVYFVHPGSGFTATATSPTTAHDRFGELFDDILTQLIFDP